MLSRLSPVERLRRSWRKAIDYNREREAWPTIAKARELFVNGSEEEARDYLAGALERFPDDPELRLLYGTTLLSVCPEQGIREAMQAAELAPTEPTFHVRAAWLMYRMDRKELARDTAACARKMGGENCLFGPELIQLESHFALEDGDEAAAEAGLRLALQRDPQSGDIAVDLASFLSDRGRTSEALKIIQRTVPVARLERDKVDLETFQTELGERT